MMRAMSIERGPEFAEFWAERHLCTLSTVRPDGTPHVVPVGVTFDEDAGVARIITHGASWKVKHVRKAGYAAYKVGDNVTTHEAWGLGSYCFFNVNPSVRAENAFEVPNRSGVRLHNLLTVSLNYQGTITHVVNNVGGVTPPGTVPVNVVSYP